MRDVVDIETDFVLEDTEEKIIEEGNVNGN